MIGQECNQLIEAAIIILYVATIHSISTSLQKICCTIAQVEVEILKLHTSI